MPSSQPNDPPPDDRERLSDWKDAISRAMRGDFGPPGESLRSDIMEELADHLSESMKREERAGRNEAEARERVLKRFGSPSQIAARLWFDGMKGSIMFQRWMMGVTAAALLISVATAGMAFWFSFEFQEINRNNKSLLAAVDKLEQRISTSQSMDWVNVKFKCIDVDTDKPAKDVVLSLSGGLLSNSDDRITVTTDENGTSSIGPVRPGTHILHIYPSRHWSTDEKLVVMPGKDSEFVFQCPVEDPKQTSSVNFKLPPVMQGTERMAQVEIRLSRKVDGRVFSFDDGSDRRWIATADGRLFTETLVEGETNLELRSSPVQIYSGEYNVNVHLLKVESPLHAGRYKSLGHIPAMPASMKTGKLHLTAKPDAVEDWHIIPDNIVPEQWIKEFKDKEPGPVNLPLPPLPETAPERPKLKPPSQSKLEPSS